MTRGKAPEIVVVAGIPYLRASGVARVLGVPYTQVDSWRARSDRNGFPRPLMVEREGLRPLPVWDEDEVVAWRRGYAPSAGGHRAGPGNPCMTPGSARSRYAADGSARRAS